MYRISNLLERSFISQKVILKALPLTNVDVKHYTAVSTWIQKYERHKTFHSSQNCLYRSGQILTINKPFIANKYSYTISNNDHGGDDLQSILKDKSIGIVGKFKILFKQYGLVVVVVHCITAVIWVAMFYFAVSRGIDVIPLLEKYGVLDFMEKIPYMPAKEKITESGAKDWVLVYVIYEIFKPIRYLVTIFGTVFAVRYLRRFGYMKLAPKIKNQVHEIMNASNNIIQHRMKNTANNYSSRMKNTANNYSSRMKNTASKYSSRMKNTTSKYSSRMKNTRLKQFRARRNKSNGNRTKS